MKTTHVDHSPSICKIESMLSDVNKLMNRQEQEIEERYAITSPQLKALHQLYQQGDLTIGELSQRMGFAYSSMTTLIDRLEALEMVQRVRDQRDRRVVRICLMPPGEKLIRQVMQNRCNFLAEALSSLSSQQVNTLAEHLTLLCEKISNEVTTLEERTRYRR